MADPQASEPVAAGLSPRLIAALVLGQMGVHASMSGFRMAAPLQALGEGAGTGTVGFLVALFALAPVMLALKAGRMADRYGFHKPMGVAVGLAMTGALLAVVSTQLPGLWHVLLLGAGSLLSGAGANFGVLAIQRTAGLAARDAAERVRLFSWLGVAPSLANVLGPVGVGVMIDWAGFPAAFGLVFALPLLTVWAIRQVPPMPHHAHAAPAAGRPSFLSLLQVPGLKRLLMVNWLLAMCWDVHGFAVPVLGHGLGFSASTIGLVLGTFTLSVSVVRAAMPLWAHRVSSTTAVVSCMLGTAVVYAVYPLATEPWMMACCSAVLGVTLGSTQPMIMTMLHQLTPDGRHGESLAMRSMAINLSSVLMPLAFGALGLALGAGALFWLVGTAVGSGAWLARRLRPV